jgi:uncharacterized protein YkwD
MYSKISIIISVILVITSAILTLQSSSMLQISYAQSLSFQSCPDGSTPDASGSCPTETPPAGDGETAETPPAGDGETAETPPATETPPPAAPPTGASQGADFVNTILNMHNQERALVGVPPLVWSAILAADAQEYADHLAAIDKMQHMWESESTEWSQKAHGANENLAAFTHGCGLSSLVPPLDYTKAVCPGDTLRTMVMSWVNEKKDFSGTYNNGGTNNGAVIGHYTQMIWKATTELGCGMASGSIQDQYGQVTDYLVCRYLPSGNSGPDPFA